MEIRTARLRSVLIMQSGKLCSSVTYGALRNSTKLADGGLYDFKA